MKSVFRLATALLLVCVAMPSLVQAGGGMAEDPYEIGRKLLAGKHYKTALAYFQKALRRNEVQAHYGLGLVFEATGKYSDALNHYRQFLDQGPPEAQRNDAVRRILAIEDRLKGKATQTTRLLDRGKKLFKKGQYREAETILLKAASEDDSRPEIHFFLGEVYLKLEEYGKAKSEFNKAQRNY